MKVIIFLLSLGGSDALRVQKTAAIAPAATGEEQNRKVFDWCIDEKKQKFPHKPAGEMDGSNIKTPENACKPDILTYTVKAGMGSQINNVMNMLWLADYGGFSIALPDSPDLQAILRPSFNLNLPVCENADAITHVNPGRTRFYIANVLQPMVERNGDWFAEGKRAIYKKYYKLNEETQKQVDQRVKELELPSKYIGVHVRHGTKELEAVPLPNDYYAKRINEVASGTGPSSFAEKSGSSVEYYTNIARKVKKIVENTEVRTVYIASDDPEAHPTIKGILGEKYLVKGVHTKESEGKTHDYKNDEARLSILADIEVLRNAETFIGTASSSVGKMVYFLRSKEQKSISLDDMGHWLSRVA